MNSKEAKILETISKHQKHVTAWRFEPLSKPYTWYHIDDEHEIPPHIAIAFPKEADFRHFEDLHDLLRNRWDELLNPREYPDCSIAIYYISIQD